MLSARAVFTRLLDGVASGIVNEIRHASTHVSGIDEVIEAKARWIGHKLHANLTIAINSTLSVAAVNAITASLQRELRAHLPVPAVANVRFAASTMSMAPAKRTEMDQ